MSEDINFKKKSEAKHIIDVINSEISQEFNKLKGIHMNPNTQGGVYEKSISEFFTKYLGSRFDFHVRAQLLDVNMEYLNLLSHGKNEVDVVATFNNCYPKIVMKVGDENFIPYDGVAFMVEIKTTIKKDTLTSDLDKFEIINTLPLSEDRLGGAIVGGDYIIEKPIRILLYFESEIDRTVMDTLLEEHYSAWDIVFILQKNEILLNPSLPFVKNMMERRNVNSKIFSFGGDNLFILFLLIVSTTIPIPAAGVNTIRAFLNLDKYSKQKFVND